VETSEGSGVCLIETDPKFHDRLIFHLEDERVELFAEFEVFEPIVKRVPIEALASLLQALEGVPEEDSIRFAWKAEAE
jgi:hypothetical protein